MALSIQSNNRNNRRRSYFGSAGAAIQMPWDELQSSETNRLETYLSECPLLHKADNPTVPAFIRFWTKADKVGFWPAMVCPQMTHSSHRGRTTEFGRINP